MEKIKSKVENQKINSLQLIKKILDSYLDITVQEQKFTGKIHIEINCRDGGIGNMHFNVSQDFNEKSIDNLNILS